MSESTCSSLHLNEPAPDVKAKTTYGGRSVSEHKGKWPILLSYPADFTPVCTTEPIGFQEHADTSSAA